MLSPEDVKNIIEKEVITKCNNRLRHLKVYSYTGSLQTPDINQENIRNSKRTRFHVVARQMCLFLIKHKLPKISNSYIAALYNRDHATLNHAKKVICDYYQTDNIFRSVMEEMYEFLEQIHIFGDEIEHVIKYNSNDDLQLINAMQLIIENQYRKHHQIGGWSNIAAIKVFEKLKDFGLINKEPKEAVEVTEIEN